MSQNLPNMLDNTISKIKEMLNANSVIGEPITTADGVTIIPISKISVGLAGGGSDFVSKNVNHHENPFGGGVGAAELQQVVTSEVFVDSGRSIQESVAKHKIVVTHHCPTMRFVDPRFITSNVNSAFCINLDKFIENSDIEYWIFGHTHYNGGSGTYIGNTLLLCNQLGYTKYGENKSFLKGCYIEIK